MTRVRTAFGVAAILAACNAGATDYEYGVTLGVGRSDNIARVSVNEQSENIATTGFDLRLVRDSGRVTADVDVDLAYFVYQDSSFDNEVLGIANADIRFKLVPDRLEWILLENFGQNELNPFLAASPDNRENINYLTTGPELNFQLGSLVDLTLFGRFSMTDFQESDFDDERLLGGVSVARELSTQSNVSLNATSERVEFDDTDIGSNYDRQSAYLGYEVEGVRTRIAAEAGYSVIHDLSESDGSPLLYVDIERDLSESSTLSLRGGVRSSDNSTSLRAGTTPGGGVPGGPDQSSTSVPFELRHVTLGWEVIALRTQIVFQAGYEQEIYEQDEQDVNLDRANSFIRASAERRLTPRISLSAQAALFKSDFAFDDQSDDETQFGLFFVWNPVGRLFIEADVEWLNRESTEVSTEFDETRVFFRFAWRGSNRSSGAR